MADVEYKEKGNIAFSKGDYCGAVDAYTKAIKHNPTIDSYYGNRSAAYLKQGQYELALKDATKCITLNPESHKGYGRKGAVYQALKKYDKAIVAYTTGLKYCPNEPHLLRGISVTKQYQVDTSKANKQALRKNNNTTTTTTSTLLQTKATLKKNRSKRYIEDNNAVAASSSTDVSEFVKQTRLDLKLQMAAIQSQLDLINELAAMKEDEKLELLFTLIDQDKDGTVDAKELAIAMRKRNDQLSFQDSIDNAIDMVATFDINGDAKLDRNEFKTYIHVMLNELGGTFTDFSEFLVIQILFSDNKNTNNNNNNNNSNNNNHPNSNNQYQKASSDNKNKSKMNFPSSYRVQVDNNKSTQHNNPYHNQQQQPSPSSSRVQQDHSGPLMSTSSIQDEVKAREFLFDILSDERMIELYRLFDTNNNNNNMMNNKNNNSNEIVNILFQDVAVHLYLFALNGGDLSSFGVLPINNKKESNTNNTNNKQQNTTTTTTTNMQNAIHLLFLMDKKQEEITPRTLNYEQFGRLIMAIVAAIGCTFDDIADEFIMSLVSNFNNYNRTQQQNKNNNNNNPHGLPAKSKSNPHTQLLIEQNKKALVPLFVKESVYQMTKDLNRKFNHQGCGGSSNNNNNNKDNNSNKSDHLTVSSSFIPIPIDPLTYGRLQQLFQLWDTDQNGQMTLQELANGLEKFQSTAGLTSRDAQKEASSIFAYFETDNHHLQSSSNHLKMLDTKLFAFGMVQYAHRNNVAIHDLIDFLCVTTVILDSTSTMTTNSNSNNNNHTMMTTVKTSINNRKKKLQKGNDYDDFDSDNEELEEEEEEDIDSQKEYTRNNNNNATTANISAKQRQYQEAYGRALGKNIIPKFKVPSFETEFYD